MPLDPDNIAAIAAVDRLYAGLISTAAILPDAEPSLGGNLLYAGELSPATSALVVAANIAGAATLAATADRAMHKQANRGGLVDFLVTTLDEALRILKNQVRKRETVAVCVTQPHEQVAREMVELGVLPDRLPPAALVDATYGWFLARGALPAQQTALPAGECLLAWSVAAAPARWLPRIDAIVLDCLDARAKAARRWLRLAPRYLGRTAQSLHFVRCDHAAASSFLAQLRQKVAEDVIAVPVEVRIGSSYQAEAHSFTPQGAQSLK